MLRKPLRLLGEQMMAVPVSSFVCCCVSDHVRAVIGFSRCGSSSPPVTATTAKFQVSKNGKCLGSLVRVEFCAVVRTLTLTRFDVFGTVEQKMKRPHERNLAGVTEAVGGLCAAPSTLCCTKPRSSIWVECLECPALLVYPACLALGLELPAARDWSRR